MVSHLPKFTPDLAEETKPLRDLLFTKTHWHWDTPQKEAFTLVKKPLTQNPILALFDPIGKTLLSADATSYGLGAVLMQKQRDSTICHIAYASRSMTSTQQRYAQIEKDALAITCGCEQFSDYLI